MSARRFVTVPEELIGHAETAAKYFRKYGYTAAIEKEVIGFPYTPALVCKRRQTTLIIEVDSKADMRRLEEWARYAHSCPADTRVGLVVPPEPPVPRTTEKLIRDMGIGLFESTGDDLTELIPAMDLALGVELPDLRKERPEIRRLLGSVYEQFERSNWREGFDDACKILESEAREYLKASVRPGGRRSIAVVDRRGRTMNLTVESVEKLTMGGLATAFNGIQAQTHADATVAKVLDRLNKDRVRITHFRLRPGTERRLRANVGQHMWQILAALKAIRNVP